MTLSRYFLQALRIYPALLYYSFLPISSLVALKHLYLLFGSGHSATGISGTLTFLVLGGMAVYIISGLLLLSEQLLEKKRQNLYKYCVLRLCNQAGRIAVVWLFFSALPLICYQLMYNFLQALGHGNNVYSPLLLVMFAGCLLLSFFLMYFFIWHIAVLETVPLWRAFARVPFLISNKIIHLVQTFFLYASLILIGVFLSPNTLHAHFLARHDLVMVFDFLTLWLGLPWCLSASILLYKQLKTYVQI